MPRGLTVPTNEDSNWVLGSIIVTIAMVVYCFGTMGRFFLEGRRLPRH